MVAWGYREPDDTIHFNVGKLTGASTAAAAGTPDPDAMAVFGQLNVHKRVKITAMHQHLIVEGGSGTSSFEIYRRRDGVFTLLGTLTIISTGGSHGFATVTPTGGLEFLLSGDYLFCQALSLQTGPGADGLTLDVHFDGV